MPDPDSAPARIPMSTPSKVASTLATLALTILLGLSTLAGCLLKPPRPSDMTEVPPDMGAPNAYSCSCVCTGSGQQIALDPTACYPAELNPVLTTSLDPSFQPSSAQLQRDCSTRVGLNLTQLTKSCVAASINCVCDAVAGSTVFATECNVPCQPDVLAQDCSNFDPLAQPPVKTATNTVGNPPVCLAASSDPPDPVPDPLAAGIFGRSSRCELAGSVTIADDDGNAQSQPASGVAHFSGGPCSGGTCQLGMSYRLDNVGTFDFGGFLGFDGVKIEGVRSMGATLPGAVPLDASGAGTLPARSAQISARGKQIDEGLISDDVATKSYVGTNSSPVDVQALWDARTCALNGALIGGVDAGHGASIRVDMAGTLVNQPPTANAGGNQTVECTSPAGASITLDGSGSTDPDGSTGEGNIAFYVWRSGSRFGPEVDPSSAINKLIKVDLAVGASQTYFLKVIDAYGQVSEASSRVNVVDTTPPVISSVTATPSVLWAPNHKFVPVTVSATATDLCGPASCRIAAVREDPTNGPGDGNTAPDWQIVAADRVNLRAERAGNLGNRVYTVTVECTDPSGNRATKATTVTVPHN